MATRDARLKHLRPPAPKKKCGGAPVHSAPLGTAGIPPPQPLRNRIEPRASSPDTATEREREISEAPSRPLVEPEERAKSEREQTRERKNREQG